MQVVWTILHALGEMAAWGAALALFGGLAGRIWGGGWALGILAESLPLIAAAALLGMLLLPAASPWARAACWIGLAGFAALAVWAAPVRSGEEREGEERIARMLQGNLEGRGAAELPAPEGFDLAALCELRGEPGGSERFPARWGELELAASSEEAGIYARGKALRSGRIGEGLAPWSQGIWAEVELSGGARALVIGVHANAPRNQRRQESRDAFFRELSKFLAIVPEEFGEIPVILAGDFNATPFGRAGAEIFGREGVSMEPDAWSPTWPAKAARYRIGWRIDRTLGLFGARIASWRALPMGGSDHLLSVSEIALPVREGR